MRTRRSSASAAQTKAASVEVEGVQHSFGEGIVLDDVSLTVAAGQSIALLGPSGCGKTTLLRTIAGLERPNKGTITVGGTTAVAPGTFVPPERRRVGMVFQDWALFPHLSVAKNVGYGLPRRGSTEAVEQGLEMVGLAGLGERMPSTLSGGQQQRVALARALAPRPSVLLLDEPFSNLDTTMRVDVRSEVHRLLLDLGITAVFVTHDQEEAFIVGDRVAVMNEGRIVQFDTPHALYDDPCSRWVADFVGEASFLPCEASGNVAKGVLGPIILDDEHRGAVEVLIRPEQLSLTDDGKATVENVEFYGHDAMVVVDLDGQTLRIRTGPSITVARGDRVGVAYVGREARAFPLTST